MSRFCNVPDQVVEFARQSVCKWRHAPIRWTVVRGLAGFAIDDLVDVYRQAWRNWEEVSGVRMEYVPASGNANILVGARRIDRQFGTLAEAQLPCGNVQPGTQLQVWFDESESWVVAANPPQGKMDLLRVAIHEFGHSLGIGHSDDGIRNAIMDPSVSRIRSLQAWDIGQAQMRYGEPSRTPADQSPRPAPTPGGEDKVLPRLLQEIGELLAELILDWLKNRKAKG